MSIMSKAHQVGEKIIELVDTKLKPNLQNINDDGKQVIIDLARGIVPPAKVELPVGSIIAWGGTGTPENYLLLDGRELSKTTYNKLYDVVGDSMGTASTSSYFKLADLTGNKYLTGSTVAGGNVSPSVSANVTTKTTSTSGTTSSDGKHNHPIFNIAGGGAGVWTNDAGSHSHSFSYSKVTGITLSVSSLIAGGIKTRYFIKYR